MNDWDHAAPPPPAPLRVRLPLHPPRLTYLLLVLMGLVFSLQYLAWFSLGYDFVGFYGAKDNELIAHGEVWRLFTAIFIHGGLLHFIFNAYALYNLGTEVESAYGGLRFALLFIFSGLAGSVSSLLFTPAPSVGASGAIFGLIGALGVLLYRNRRVFGERGRRNLQNLLTFAAINLIFGLTTPGIDNWAHLGGLAGGAVLSWIIGPVWELPPWPPLWPHELTIFRPAELPPPVLADQNTMDIWRWGLVSIVFLGLTVLALLGILWQLILRRLAM